MIEGSTRGVAGDRYNLSAIMTPSLTSGRVHDTPPPAASPRARRSGAALAAARPRSRRSPRTGSSASTIGCPWRLPDDMQALSRADDRPQRDHGTKTWESIGRALPDRQNIVVTRQRRFRAPRVAESRRRSTRRSRSCALPEPAFCIGGGELYRAALPHATLRCISPRSIATSTATRAFPTSTRELARDRRASAGTG